MATKQEMEIIPQKHTPRNTLVATLFDMNFTLEEIRRKFSWVSASEMPFRYVRYRLDKLPKSVSFSLSREAQTNGFAGQDAYLNN